MPKGIYIRSEETRAILSDAHKRSQSCKRWLRKLHKLSKGKHYSPSTEIKKGQHLSIKTEYKKGSFPINGFKKGKVGDKCPAWKGGRIRHNFGYILIHRPEHPSSDKRGYVLEHRLVMEKHIGRYLKSTEIVHHINEKRTDNRIQNLMLFPNIKSHLEYHRFNASPWPGIR